MTASLTQKNLHSMTSILPPAILPHPTRGTGRVNHPKHPRWVPSELLSKLCTLLQSGCRRCPGPSPRGRDAELRGEGAASASECSEWSQSEQDSGYKRSGASHSSSKSQDDIYYMSRGLAFEVDRVSLCLNARSENAPMGHLDQTCLAKCPTFINVPSWNLFHLRPPKTFDP